MSDMQTNPKKIIRKLQVCAALEISPHYRRVTLTGEQLKGFPVDQTGGYIKLIFHEPQFQKPLMRTYTIRNTRMQQLEIDIDVVLHEDAGPASLWAKHVQIGSEIEISGPGPKKLVDPNADWFLFAGDMTALPAICVNLEQLPTEAQGVAVLEIPSESDMQQLTKPDKIEIEWIVNPRPGLETSSLVNAIKAVTWQRGTPGIWTACEFKTMKELRKYFIKEKGINRKAFYISSYWKHGVSEDEHKLIKKTDSSQFNQI